MGKGKKEERKGEKGVGEKSGKGEREVEEKRGKGEREKEDWKREGRYGRTGEEEGLGG